MNSNKCPGSLLFMKRSAVESMSGNVDDGSLTSQVSTIWLLSSNTGSYVGSLAGAAAFDKYGFPFETFIETLVLLLSIALLTLYGIIMAVMSRRIRVGAGLSNDAQ